MHGDVVAAARVLYEQPEGRRGLAMRGLLRQATWADRHRRISGRIHPLWGDGSLMSAALNRCPGPEPALSDAVYCTCLSMVLEALVVWRGDKGPNERRRRKCRWALSDRVPGV